MTINASIAFLMEAAVYFTKRPTGGEDLAHWSNVLNAENCTKAADLLTHQSLRIEALEKALRPFTFDSVSSKCIDPWDDETGVEVHFPRRKSSSATPVGRLQIEDIRAARAAIAKAEGR